MVKNTLPIIGVTKVAQVQDAATASKIVLTNEEMKILETLAENTGVNTKGAWEKPMM